MAIIDDIAVINRKNIHYVVIKDRMFTFFIILVLTFIQYFLLFACIGRQNLFRVFGAFNDLELKLNICNQIGKTCSCLIQSCKIRTSNPLVRLSK